MVKPCIFPLPFINFATILQHSAAFGGFENLLKFLGVNVKCRFMGKELRELRLLAHSAAGGRLAQFLTHKFSLLSKSYFNRESRLNRD